MPYRSNRQAQHAESHRRSARAVPPALPAKRRDYTFNHAGRQFRIGPITFWLSVSTLIVMALWSAATATYFAFRDDVLTRLIARQAEMQYAYEERAADLRSQVDRLTSRQLLDQEQVEQRIESLAQRQKSLEARTSVLSGLPDETATASIRGKVRPLHRRNDAAGASPKPSPISDTVILAPPLERKSNLESRLIAPRNGMIGTAKSAGLATALTRVQESLDRVEAEQSGILFGLEDGYETKARRLRLVLADLGVNIGAERGSPAGVGGPFVPPNLAADAGAFERQMQRVQIARANLERLHRVMLTVPVRRPLAGEIETSSGFGVRLDPFLRRPAMHTGQDFRAETGNLVRATAAGTVESSGWNGGYGRMVEIDHGNGLSTRYAHLSAISVKEGQTVKPGQVIGRVGSTGRSTGPHLHYETRIDGEAVDPRKFLRAGMRLGEKL